MQQHYGLSAEDIFAMSFRRFCVLFGGIFSWNADAPQQFQTAEQSRYERAVHEARGASGRIAHSFDWDTAMGRAPAERREILTTGELMRNRKENLGKMGT